MISLVCKATIMVNLSLYPWTPKDHAQKRQSEKRCKEIYADAPCLVKFTKTSKNDYRALCGSKK